jgi:hypothetical protein
MLFSYLNYFLYTDMNFFFNLWVNNSTQISFQLKRKIISIFEILYLSLILTCIFFLYQGKLSYQKILSESKEIYPSLQTIFNLLTILWYFYYAFVVRSYLLFFTFYIFSSIHKSSKIFLEKRNVMKYFISRMKIMDLSKAKICNTIYECWTLIEKISRLFLR